MSIKTSPEHLVEELSDLGITEVPGFGENDDVRPTNEIPVVYIDANGATQYRLMRWGLVPADSPKFKGEKPWFNARGETIHFVEPWARVWKKEQRCIVPVASWFEWPMLGGTKRKMRISRAAGKPFVFAGIYEIWKQSGDPHDWRYSFTTITCKPTEEFALYHDRMPVIIDRDQRMPWLQADTKTAKGMLKAYPEGILKYEPL